MPGGADDQRDFFRCDQFGQRCSGVVRTEIDHDIHPGQHRRCQWVARIELARDDYARPRRRREDGLAHAAFGAVK